MKKTLTVIMAMLLVSSSALPVARPASTRAASTSTSRMPSERVALEGPFRTYVTLSGPAARARLDRLGVTVLEEGTGWAVVLTDADQLAALARLRFEPVATENLGLLVEANAEAAPWLVRSVQPVLDHASAARRLNTELTSSSQPDASAAALLAAETDLRTAIRALTAEQQAGLAALATVDDDGDGLTNTEEQWWCTDPLDLDSDSDGVNDGDEVQAAREWLANERGGPPASGKPFVGWPPDHPGCYDDDQDSIPDLAETWHLGLNPNRESTDRDKFDDGQELFGNTYCPGSGGFCGYGVLPRNEDWGVVFAEMPSWVEAPGNHPFATAFPVPEIDVTQSSLHVETVTVVTTDHGISEGTERSYSTSETQGTSSSVANTTTWNEWEEVSESRPLVRTKSLSPKFRLATASVSANAFVNYAGLWQI